MATPKTHTPATLAEQLGTTAKVMRKFIRSESGLNRKVGQGARWEISSADAAKLRKAFPKWKAQQDAERAERAAQRAEQSASEVEDETDETPDSDETPEDDDSDTE